MLRIIERIEQITARKFCTLHHAQLNGVSLCKGQGICSLVSVHGAALSAQAAISNELAGYFNAEGGFDAIVKIDTIDGVRIYFANGDIAHIRPSGNAPQLRLYSCADTQARADEIVALGIREPDGILRRLEGML